MTLPGLPPRAWHIPPEERRLTSVGVHAYIECELELTSHFELWRWLHDLTYEKRVVDRLAEEAQDFLLTT